MDVRHCNQIHHVTICKQQSNILVRSCREADINSNHIVVKVDLKMKKPNKKRHSQRKENAIKQKYIGHNRVITNSIEWKNKETIINTATEEVITRKQSHRKDEWWDKECKNERKVRNELRMKAIQSQQENNKKNYKEQEK